MISQLLPMRTRIQELKDEVAELKRKLEYSKKETVHMAEWYEYASKGVLYREMAYGLLIMILCILRFKP